ncbi:hypothetical protein VNO80_12931 [Phaseolus coccineus]|uniref:Uncharacterized protein n=1 Tax=Phaseolus coccineus TaxID=3886 RepID=A0AAN9N0Z3_PHACN
MVRNADHNFNHGKVNSACTSVPVQRAIANLLLALENSSASKPKSKKKATQLESEIEAQSRYHEAAHLKISEPNLSVGRTEVLKDGPAREGEGGSEEGGNQEYSVNEGEKGIVREEVNLGTESGSGRVES